MNNEKSSLNNNYRQKIDERAELFDGYEKTVYMCGYKDGFIDCEEYTAPLREELEKSRAQDLVIIERALRLEKEVDELKTENERLKTAFANATEAKVDARKHSIELNTKLDRVMTDSNNKDLVIQNLREALEKFAIMGQEDGNLNGEYHVLTSTGAEKYPVSEAVRVTKNILKLVNHIAKETLKGGSDE